MIKIEINTILYQLYLLPTIKITYNKLLNSNYEFIVSWFKWELVLLIKSKN